MEARMTTKPAPKYQGCAVLRYLSLAIDAYARGTTPEAVERNAHPVLWRLGRAAHKQNGGRE
jgi:hypothetical protein